MIKKIAVPLFLFIAINSFSQSISMDFPALAGKTYDFIIFQGSKQETVQQDTIPANGKFTLKIPKKYAPYTGMCRWLITNTADGGGLDMAIPGYNFFVTCLSDTPDNNNIVYTGFNAVNELNSLNVQQLQIIEKFEVVSKASVLYVENKKLYTIFNKEKIKQKKAFENFNKQLKSNPSFNARFLPILNLTKGIPPHLTANEDEKAAIYNQFITKDLNFNDLYVSGHWTAIIRDWVGYQSNVVQDTAQFVKDFQLISDRITNPTQYTDFVGKLTYYLTTFGKDNYVAAITNAVLGSGKVNAYAGSLQVYIKATIGKQAPDLVIKENVGSEKEVNLVNTLLKTTSLASKYSLLLFYQSDCGPCKQTIAALKDHYSNLVAKGIKIVALSADTDPQVFKDSAAAFSWKDNYCNLEGFKGINFKNYAVTGTPTMFILNSKGILLKKIATIEQLLTWSEKL
ncbi:peroxiredoxin family protein [Polaribacter sp. M15]